MEPHGSIQRQQHPSSQVNLSELGKTPKCDTFATHCKTRVDLLEQYRKEADVVIKGQEAKISNLKEEKKSFPWVHTIIGVLAGALLGVALLKQF